LGGHAHGGIERGDEAADGGVGSGDHFGVDVALGGGRMGGKASRRWGGSHGTA
jgi:hypothetical protein